MSNLNTIIHILNSGFMYFHILLNTKIIIVWKQVGDFRSAIPKFRFLHFQQRERERGSAMLWDSCCMMIGKTLEKRVRCLSSPFPFLLNQRSRHLNKNHLTAAVLCTGNQHQPPTTGSFRNNASLSLCWYSETVNYCSLLSWPYD